jgi:transposase IS204/IS1001/IS1096/IS1165 family protein/transposase ISL3 family protein
VRDESTAATVLLGLPGFRLLAVSEYAGELEQAIETTASEAFCPSCGVLARLHDWRPSWVRDLPLAGQPVTLVWVTRVWRCQEPACATQTWTEKSEVIRPRASLTERAQVEACRRVGRDGHTVAAIAAEFGVGWGTVMAAVRQYAGRWSNGDSGLPTCAPSGWTRPRPIRRGHVFYQRPSRCFDLPSTAEHQAQHPLPHSRRFPSALHDGKATDPTCHLGQRYGQLHAACYGAQCSGRSRPPATRTKACCD